VEVKNLKEVREALRLNPDIIMLDNMSKQNIKKAVRMRDRLKTAIPNLAPRLEASGRINLKNIKKIASTGVDMISIGDLTHSVKSIDISLEVL
jgi:nicotinate-nucleotide pyrophosphorylase (carboxylating)